jgi:hypothetical protein
MLLDKNLINQRYPFKGDLVGSALVTMVVLLRRAEVS